MPFVPQGSRGGGAQHANDSGYRGGTPAAGTAPSAARVVKEGGTATKRILAAAQRAAAAGGSPGLANPSSEELEWEISGGSGAPGGRGGRSRAAAGGGGSPAGGGGGGGLGGGAQPPQQLDGAAAREIVLETIKSLFHLPIVEAAKRLGVSRTSLKAVCRRHGVSRWPKRSLDRESRILAAAAQQQQQRGEEREAAGAQGGGPAALPAAPAAAAGGWAGDHAAAAAAAVGEFITPPGARGAPVLTLRPGEEANAARKPAQPPRARGEESGRSRSAAAAAAAVAPGSRGGAAAYEPPPPPLPLLLPRGAAAAELLPYLRGVGGMPSHNLLLFPSPAPPEAAAAAAAPAAAMGLPPFLMAAGRRNAPALAHLHRPTPVVGVPWGFYQGDAVAGAAAAASISAAGAPWLRPPQQPTGAAEPALPLHMRQPGGPSILQRPRSAPLADDDAAVLRAAADALVGFLVRAQGADEDAAGRISRRQSTPSPLSLPQAPAATTSSSAATHAPLNAGATGAQQTLLPARPPGASAGAAATGGESRGGGALPGRQEQSPAPGLTKADDAIIVAKQLGLLSRCAVGLRLAPAHEQDAARSPLAATSARTRPSL